MDDTAMHSSGFLAISIALASAAIGAIYYLYLTLDAFPPDILRIVPLIWLVGAFIAFVLGLQAVLTNANRGLGLLSVAINIASIPLAAAFALGAVMGD